MRSTQEEREENDPVRAASGMVGLLVENDRVRVLGSTLKPGDKAAMHSHPDYVVYVLKGGMLRMTSPSGEETTMEFEQGKALLMEAQTHEVTNVGDTEVELVVIELK
jgi:quercetin dioxygenase-like cupin family protein